MSEIPLKALVWAYPLPVGWPGKQAATLPWRALPEVEAVSACCCETLLSPIQTSTQCSTFASPSPAQRPDTAHWTEFAQQSAGTIKRILVVEDDASTSNALRQLLTACGYQVVIVGTVAAAQAAVNDSFHAVILDLMLPDGDGADVLLAIRGAGLKARVCVTTGVSTPAWLNRVRSLGAHCILQKPIELSALLDKLS